MVPRFGLLDVLHHLGDLLTIQTPGAADLVRISRDGASDDFSMQPGLLI